MLKSRMLKIANKAFSIFRRANRKIPKSGEVWWEGARLLMSPVSHRIDLNKAEQYLNFAIQFTPQYGDSFLELFKLYTLKGDYDKIKELKNTWMHSEPNYGILWFYFKNNLSDTALDIWNSATIAIAKEVEEMRSIYESKIKGDLAYPNIESEFWTGYKILSCIYKKGINHQDSNLSFEEKWRNIYGFEQITDKIVCFFLIYNYKLICLINY